MEENGRRPPLPRRDPGASDLRAPPPEGVPALPRRQPGASGRQAAGRRPPQPPPVSREDDSPTAPQPVIRWPVLPASPVHPEGAPEAVSETAAPAADAPEAAARAADARVAAAPV